jgi:transcriptional regulator with XRE-family HTH domain/CheY-like chemotaxis protein
MDIPESNQFGRLLKWFRDRSHFTQERLAHEIGQRSRGNIQAWETGLYLPREREIVLMLARALRLSESETDTFLLTAHFPQEYRTQGILTPSAGIGEHMHQVDIYIEEQPFEQRTVKDEQLRFAAEFPSVWNVPYRSHPLFADRKDILQMIHDRLSSPSGEAVMVPQVFSGPGGIGKTRFATEYAFHYRGEYDAVLWMNAESRDILLTQYIALADALHLPEKDMQDQRRIRDAVTRWLTEHERWLLIIDNADDIDMVQEFIPPTGRGHVLLTSRARAMGAVAHRIVLDLMMPDDGALFLLRRATILEPADSLESADEADRNEALALTQLMGGLPLALDQVGAYIEETMCGVSGYVEVYRTHARELLNERGEVVIDHPNPIATTWLLAFERIDKQRAAAELLRLCAFLYPDAIPEEILRNGERLADNDIHQPILASQYELNQAARELIKSSLIQRNDRTKMFTIHRLVQDALKNYWMSQASLPLWATQAVRAVHRIFPTDESASWEQCQRFLPQVFACKNILDTYGLNFVEAAQLFERAAHYLSLRAEYDQAEPLYQKAIVIYRNCLDERDLAIVDCAERYADLLRKMQRIHDAELYEQMARQIRSSQS